MGEERGGEASLRLWEEAGVGGMCFFLAVLQFWRLATWLRGRFGGGTEAGGHMQRCLGRGGTAWLELPCALSESQIPSRRVEYDTKICPSSLTCFVPPPPLVLGD